MSQKLYHFRHKTPYGNSLIAHTANALVHISLRPKNPKENLHELTRLGYQLEKDRHPLGEKVAKQLDEYFKGKRRSFQLKVELHGTDFQKQVWNELMRVDFGEMVSYGELAEQVGHPLAARAVGTTMAKNRIPIIIPCHRVIASNRKLGGYTGGTDIKKQLLALENITI